MTNFRILLADDLRSERYIVNLLLKNLNSELEVIRVANPAQAKVFFDQNRESACSLCVISDRDMSKPNYEDTDCNIPALAKYDLSKNLFDNLNHYAKTWHQGTGNQVFIVRRSADDAYSDSLDKLRVLKKNNFLQPFIFSKLEAKHSDYLREILKHCKKLFHPQEA